MPRERSAPGIFSSISHGPMNTLETVLIIICTIHNRLLIPFTW